MDGSRILKHATAKRAVIYFNLQVVHAASLQKRDILQDIFVQPIVLVQQQIQAAISQAQRVIQEIQNQIASAIASVTVDLQARATAVTNQISTFVSEVASIPTCAIGQADAVATIVSQSGKVLHQLLQLLVAFIVKSGEYSNGYPLSTLSVKYFT